MVEMPNPTTTSTAGGEPGAEDRREGHDFGTPRIEMDQQAGRQPIVVHQRVERLQQAADR